MNAATALVTGAQAVPALAADAVRTAMAKARLQRIGGVLLFLSNDFLRQPQPAILAAAREAECLQVFGMVANGLLNETGWSLDQPAAAALVLGNGLSLANARPDDDRCLSFTGGSSLPVDWRDPPLRHGLLVGAAPVWQQGRVMGSRRSEAAVHGARCAAALSTGLQQLGSPLPVEAAHGYDIGRIDGQPAVTSLHRALPAPLRQRSPLPLHLVSAIRVDGGPAVPILGVNADGSLTMAEEFAAGDRIVWAVRQPLTAEREMTVSLEGAATACPIPDFALMFSCIGRGPLFYSGDDRDLHAFRRRFPATPLLGAYGTGQIHPLGGHNRQFQNSVVTLLFESEHVQSLP